MTMWTQAAFALVLLVGAVSCYPEGRVVNGTNAKIEDYPFMVSIRAVTGNHSCGGSIIASRWVMTAAHCALLPFAAKTITIQYGSAQIAANASNVVGVKRVFVHEAFRLTENLPNDIALLELKSELVFNNKTVAPVTLPESYFEVNQTLQGSTGTLIGWGLNATGGSIQSNLQQVNLKIYSDEECNSRHNNATTVDHICGGIDEGGKGQCSYDSGSPLLLNGTEQVGIVSWSVHPCGVAPFPGVYTKVSHFVDWIKQKMNSKYRV